MTTQANNVAIESSQINSSGVLLTTGGGTGLSTVGTNGQVLTSNGTTLSWVTPSASTLTGTLGVANGGTGLTSLTAGYIPYGNGTSAFGSSSNLFWDSTNSRLGIGTSSPSSLLTINNTAGGTGLAITGSGTGTQYITATNTGGNLTQGLDNSVGGLTGNAYGTFIGSYANTAMAIVTNSLVRMNITSTGYVTTPAQPAFNVNLPSTGNSGGVIIFTSVRLNTGSCYNVANGRFTAPVAGTYFFYAQLLMNSGGNDIRFDVNGSAVSVYGESDVSGYQQLSLQQVIALNAGDYVQVDIWSGTQYGGNYNNFCGYLLG